MGYFVCQHCGAHLHDSKVEDLYQWDDDKSIGWSFVCPKCKEENYRVERNVKKTDRLELNRYCPRCKKHTVHKEKK